MEIRDLYKSVETRSDYRTLSALVAFWRASAGEKELPARTDLDLSQLGSVRDHVFWVDISPAPYRFRVRQTGAMIDETFGRSFAGRWIDDPAAHFFERGNVADYVHTAIHQRPHFTCGQTLSVSSRRIQYMRMLLPLSSDGTAVDGILGGVVTSWASGSRDSGEKFFERSDELRLAIAT